MKNSLQQKYVLHNTGNRYFFSRLQKLVKKSFYNSFLLLFFFILIPGNAHASYAFSGGDGSESNPWQITTLADLDSVHNYLDSNFILMNDLDFAGSVYDSANSAEGWVCIGNSVPFTGSFNGAGYSISNLYINRPSKDSLGLFGSTDGAVIDSLAVLNCYVTGYRYIACLVGYNKSSAISACYATGRVKGGNHSIGCLVGINYYNSTITNCYATGMVSGYQYVGGLVGNNSVLNSTISNCYATGEVSGTKIIGGLVGRNTGAIINNCYATGNVSGTTDDVGGLTGQNYISGTINSCFATGRVSGTTNVGGLAGNNYSGTITNAYYDTLTTMQSAGMGLDNNSQVVTGLTTASMKQQDSFVGFNFDTVWAIRADSTYPALQIMDNAPFAFTDTIQDIGASVLFKKFLANDYDYETIQEALVVSFDSISSGNVGNKAIYLPDTAKSGDEYIVFYRVGKERVIDTLWGNMVRSVLIAGLNTAPEIQDSLNTNENIPLEISLDSLVKDAEDDAITITIIDSTLNGTVVISDESFIYTPFTDFYGTDSLQLESTDGQFEDLYWVYITVNPANNAPELTTVNNTSTLEDTPITLSSNDITASDVDGDELSLIVYTGDNYMVVDSTITPIANYNGTLSVPVSVTDGKDTSNIMNISITVDPVNDLPLLTSVKDTSTYKNTPITLTMNDVTASDVDGDALSLVVYAGDNYTFSGATVTPATNYTGTLSVPVSVTDGTDTTTNMTISITVEEVSGINNVLASDIQLFPNPVSSKLIIQGIKGTTTFEIININGQIVFTRNVSENEAINVRTLPEGTYVVVLKEYGVHKKLIIDKK